MTDRTRREFIRDGTATVAGLSGLGALGASGAIGVSEALAGLARPARVAPGFDLGFRSLRLETQLPDLHVDGHIPRWLTGSLLRNGPALFEIGPTRLNHWFDGLAMLHAFSFHNGRVSYRNRFLRSSQYNAYKRDGKMEYSELATDPPPDPCRQLFSGVSTLPVLGRIPNANVTIEKLAGQFRAHTEIPIPVRFNPRSLRTLGAAGSAPQGRLGTAHPHHDPRTGERFSYEVELVPPSGLRVISEKGRRRRELAFIPQAEPGYLHSFGLTHRYVVIVAQPFKFNLGKFLSPDRGPILTNYEWHPELPSQVILVDRRRGGVVCTAEMDPFFAFHHVNAFDRGDKVVLDVCAHRDDGVMEALYLKNIRTSHKVPQAKLRRIIVNPSNARVYKRDLIEDYIELPKTDYATVNGRPYRYAYGVGLKGRRSGFIDQLVKADVRKGESKSWRERGVYPGEPIFVARPGRRSEDDGVILSVILDADRRASALLVLDARSMEEIGRASVPHHIPFGFHGLHTART